jgi:molybdopterin molybdotransferase
MSGNPVRLADVLTWIDAHVARLDPEIVPIFEASGRTLAEDLVADIDLPPFGRGAEDGFALRSTETIGASAYNPLTFRVAPTTGEFPANSVVCVTSGDPLPVGADAVVRLEHAEVTTEEVVTIIDPVVAGQGVERAGCHCQRGCKLVVAGRRISPADVAVLASAGFARVSVTRRARIHCVFAAEGVMEAGQRLPSGYVYDANGPMLQALLHRDDGVLIGQSRVERQHEAIADALKSPGVDAILVAGGTGSGPKDCAAAALAGVGELAMHGVAIRPGQTTGIGQAGGIPVVLLPGRPTDCLWGYELIAGRVIRRLGGRTSQLPFPSRIMTTARKIVSEIGTLEIHAVRCLDESTVEPMASFSEAGLTPAARGDGFVLVPERSEGHPRGAEVSVYLRHG